MTRALDLVQMCRAMCRECNKHVNATTRTGRAIANAHSVGPMTRCRALHHVSTSLLGAFVRVILPVSLPGILTTVIFTFTLTMQEFIYALTFISTESQVPVTLGVATDLVRGDIFYWGSLMAAALIASLPFAVLYNLFLDRFIMGITGGALK